MKSVLNATLKDRWWLANSIGFFIAYVVYTPIAHGITGPHPSPLSTTQLLAHTVGLLVVSGIVLSAQLWSLERSLKIGRKRILYGALAFVAAFWIG